MGFLQRFFHGRNGTDQLNIALIVASIATTLLSRFLFLGFLSTVSYVLLFLCVFRMISRNIPRRQQENALFLEKTKRFRRGAGGGAGTGYTKQARVRKDPNYRYFKCPECKQNLRAPKGKGKINITCPKCGTVFQKTV